MTKIKDFVKRLNQRGGVLRVKRAAMHQAQKHIISTAKRFNIVVCGRRFGKTVLIRQLCTKAVQGLKIGIFAPEFKDIADTWEAIKNALEEVTIDSDNTAKRLIILGKSTDIEDAGIIEFWSLVNEAKKDAGRGRDYDIAIYEETQKIPSQVLEYHWQKVGRPTLTDRQGDAYFFGTAPNSRKHFFYKLICRGASANPDLTDARDLMPERPIAGYKTFRFPTSANPHIKPEELAAVREELPEPIFLQEYEAVCVEYGESAWLMALDDQKIKERVFYNSPLNILPNGQLWLSFDFNKNPMAATLWQVGNDASYLHCLREFGAPEGVKVNVHYTCALIAQHFEALGVKDLATANIFVTGDPTGNTSDPRQKRGKTFFEIILEELNLSARHLKLFRVAPMHAESHIHCNTYLALHKQFIVSDGCPNLRNDMLYTRATPEMKIDKKFHDPHYLDTLRYLLEAATPRKIERKNIIKL
jgi:hypothetical protein